MDAERSFVPHPPSGKPPEHLPARRPGCRYVKRPGSSTFPASPSFSTEGGPSATTKFFADQGECRGTGAGTSTSRDPDPKRHLERTRSPKPSSEVN